MNSDSEEFVRLLTEAQGPVYGYLLTLIPDRSRARDLLQETNITLWKKAATFEEGTNFNAWACKIAYFHVLSFRRKMAREKLVFDDDILDYLAERNDDRLIQDFTKDRNSALKACMQKLSDKQRNLLKKGTNPEPLFNESRPIKVER